MHARTGPTPLPTLAQPDVVPNNSFTLTAESQGTSTVTMVKPQTCEIAVPNPLDAPPIRSPQAVHTYVVKRIKGKEIVEIGTRNGDGI